MHSASQQARDPSLGPFYFLGLIKENVAEKSGEILLLAATVAPPRLLLQLLFIILFKRPSTNLFCSSSSMSSVTSIPKMDRSRLAYDGRSKQFWEEYIMEKKKLGTLYCDGKPELPSLICKDSRHITIGPTIPGKELKWVDAGEILVADRCVCLDISWDDLNALGFVFGHPVWIDNEPYLCRCLKVGNQLSKTNEWDRLLEQFGKGNDLWNAKGQYFFGQETVLGQELNRMVRGGDRADDNGHLDHTSRLTYVGFRPVLEPLAPSIRLDEALIGTRIEVWGSQALSVKGQLAGLDDYDMVLRDVSGLLDDCCWAHLDGSNAIISKKKVSYIRTTV